LWLNHLRIGLCPDRLVLTGYRRGLRPAINSKDVIRLESSPAAHWQAAADSLLPAIAACGAHKPRVTIVLSNHFVRYSLLPWNSTLTTKDEWLALARQRFAVVYGNAGDDWAFRVSETAPTGPRIVAATEQALLDAVAARIAQSGATLASVQPYLMVAYNRVRSALGAERCWLVIGEPGRLTLALIEDGVWRAVRSRVVDDRWRTELPAILERESAVLALEQPCTQAVIYTQEAFIAGANHAFRMRDLTLAGGTPLSDRRLAMVLA
jgi:hypothetical protein